MIRRVSRSLINVAIFLNVVLEKKVVVKSSWLRLELVANFGHNFICLRFSKVDVR